MQIKLKNLLPAPVQNYQATDLVETFLVSAVASFLTIRAFLKISGYPQLGGGDFHIAHMLWGGLLMSIALLMTIALLNRGVRSAGAIIGGIGFGAFIDELGKFITTDNDYFYQPTVAIIYVIFVMIYFLAKYIQHHVSYSKKTYAFNSIESLKEIIAKDLDHHERKRTLYFLSKSDSNDPVVQAITKLVKNSRYINKTDNVFEILYAKSHIFALSLIKKSIFQKVIIAYFITSSIFTFALSIAAIYLEGVGFVNVGYMLSVMVANLLSLIGIIFLVKRNRIQAYRFFVQSILVSIFISQFFLFLEDQLAAITALIFNVIIYAVLKFKLNSINGIK